MIIKCIKMGINGEGIGYADGRPVFCAGVLPGETAEVRVTEENRLYLKAECVRLLSPSAYRVPSSSEEYLCNSAPLSVLAYEQQLYWKKELLAEAIWKYGHVHRKHIRDIRPSPQSTAYRSECKLPAGMRDGQLWMGLYRSGTNHFVPIRHFENHTEELESLRLEVLDILRRHEIRAYDQKSRHGLRNVVLRSIQNHAQLTLVTGKEKLPEDMVRELYALEGLDTVAQSVNDRKNTLSVFGTTKILKGEPYLTIELEGFTLRLSPESFFQLNVGQAVQIYRTAVAKTDTCDHLFEAYCGIGVMSLMAKDRARKITGAENVPQAVRNAEANARANRVPNVSFLCADAAEGLKEADRKRTVDTLLLDPPRAGMDQAMISAVLDSDIRRIIYVSCNPATLGKNLKQLKQKFAVRTVIPFDMFPNTAHTESVTVLERTS